MGSWYPTEAAWEEVIEAECGPLGEDFLGQPLDPHGRFGTTAIHPSVEGWREDERTMWCGLALAGFDPADEGALLSFSEDVRGAEQGWLYETGTCVATPLSSPPAIVPCTEPHHMEVVGQIDLSEREEPPVGAQDRALDTDCRAQVRDYLGADPVMPWQVGKETIPPESWAANRRIIHCFVGQWGADGNLVEVTAPAKT